MAGRPPKVKIDYSGWSVDIFDSDTKIDKLIDAQGWVGFGIYFYLCQKAYGSDGYFYKWCFDDASTTARKMGGGVGAETVRETVRTCLQIGLFDNGLFVGCGILTSRGIQKRYAAVASGRRSYNQVIEEKYWLLTEEESAGLDFNTTNSNYEPSKLNYDPSKSNYDKQKERKGKEIKEKERKENNNDSSPPPASFYGSFSNVELETDNYNELMVTYENPRGLIDKVSEYLANSTKEYKNHYALILKFAREDMWPKKKKISEDVGQDVQNPVPMPEEIRKKIGNVFQGIPD